MTRLDELLLLLGALDEDVLARAALLDQLAGLVRDVEDRLELPVAAGLLVVRPAHAVPHELAEDEDRGADEERHRVVLERAAVPVPHQVVDQALGALRVLLQLVQGLLPGGGDAGGEQHVGVGRAVLDQLDGDIAAEAGLEVVGGGVGHGLRGPSHRWLGRRPLYGPALTTGRSVPAATFFAELLRIR